MITQLSEACFTVSEMIALGLDMHKETFTSQMKGGVQLLAPTGSDLTKYNTKNDILAGFHYDLNFLTIHGKSNYPGLYVWLRDGQKVAVKVPDGCLLLQSSKMLEWVTGGYFYAGFHEVIVSDETLKAVEKAKMEGKPLWRVSSTLFSTLRFDTTMKPLPRFRSLPDVLLNQYPPISTYKFVEEELKAINLLGAPTL
jgi:isopenicillin N synthase-like dioxygenase